MRSFRLGVGVMTAAALVVPGVAQPSSAALHAAGGARLVDVPKDSVVTEPSGGPRIEPPPYTDIRTVTLITGDEVRVMSRGDGRTTSSIVAGSPHAGAPVARWQTTTGSYLLPKLGSSWRRRLDPSLFDVAALAALRGGPVPIVVRFAGDTVPRPVSGLTLDLAGARKLGRATVVHGSYASGFAGLTRRDLGGVAAIRLSGPSVQPRAVGTSTHALTVNVDAVNGGPSAGTVVLIENVEDGDTFFQTPVTDAHGQITVDVPAGDYSALAFTFGRLAIAKQFDVSADRTVNLDLGAATVRPHVSLPGYRQSEAVLSVGRLAAKGFSYPLSFSGSSFYMRVPPTGPQVRDGSLTTGVSATFAPRQDRHRPAQRRLAVTADISRGIPDSLTFKHHRVDFARVVQRYYANGPAELRMTSLGAWTRGADMWTGTEYATRVPGRRVVLYQAAPKVYYQQTFLPQASPNSDNDLTQLIASGRYPLAGQSHTVTFARGPVGPGVEKTYRWVVRHDNRLQGFLPLFDGAGSAMFGFVDGQDGHWSLRRGQRVLAAGRHFIQLNARVPAATRSYVLRAASHPAAHNWQLSTSVRDVWGFRTGEGRPAVPLLTPSYLPPLSMSGFAPRGATSFRLAFHTLAHVDRRIARASLELSTDNGRTWTPARLTRTGPTTFRVQYDNPGARGASRFMSMRVTGADASGDSVREVALRVYRLR